MGRLPAGVKPTPHKERLAIYREELERTGGHRLIADIGREANDALQTIKSLDTPSNPVRGVTDKDAVTKALIHYAKSLLRRVQR